MYSSISDVLTLVQTFREVDRVVESEGNLRFVMKALEAYLEEGLSKRKKFLTGSQFAQMCDHMAFAHTHGLHTFDSKLLHKVELIFLKDQKDLYLVSFDDIYRILNFVELHQLNREPVVASLVKLTLESSSRQESSYLKLVKILEERGYVGKEQLAHHFQQFFLQQIDRMDPDTALDFLDQMLSFNREEGQVMERLTHKLQQEYFNWDLCQLSRLLNLVSVATHRPTELIDLAVLSCSLLIKEDS